MEQNLPEIQYIEDYLMGKLNEEEKAEFLKKMKDDPDFAKKVKQQYIIMQRIRQMAIKKSIAGIHKAYTNKQRFSFRNIIYNPKNAFLTFLGIILIAFIIWEAEQNNKPKENEPERIIQNEQLKDSTHLSDSILNMEDTLTYEIENP